MFKRLVLLILINIPFTLLANWQENEFNVETSYKIYNSKQPEIYDEYSIVHQLELNANKTILLDGVGIDLSGTVAPFSIEQDEISKSEGIDHHFFAEGILFLSETSDLSFKYAGAKRTELFDNRLNNILLGISEELINDSNRMEANLTLGKDKSFFYLNFQHNVSEIMKESFTSGLLLNDLNIKNSSIELLWSQSESTLWGIKAEIVKSDRELLNQQQSFDINNYYFSAVTEYFGSSQFALNLGNSKVKEKQQFSWDIEHKTFLTQHTNFSIRSYRKFEQAVDASDEEDLNTHYEANFSYQPLDYVTTELNFYNEKRKRNDVKAYERKSLKVGLAINYKKSWEISASYISERVIDHVNMQSLSQNKIQLAITRVLI